MAAPRAARTPVSGPHLRQVVVPLLSTSVDATEARAVALNVLEDWRLVPHAELVRLVDQSVWADRRGLSGADYAIQVYGLWDAGVIGGDLRVVGAAMDGTKTRFRTLRSTSADFIVTPKGRFLG